MISNTSNFLEIILQIGREVNKNNSLDATFDIIKKSNFFTRSFIFLYEFEDEKLSLTVHSKFDVTQFRRLGERVSATPIFDAFKQNTQIILPKLSREKSLGFLQNADETSWVFTPLALDGVTLGVFGAEVFGQSKRKLEELGKSLSVAASFFSQCLKMRKNIENEQQELLDENSHLRQELREKHDFSNIIGNSGEMRQVYDQVSQVARSNATVLLRGESGTGKEMIANALHYNSLRSKKPFIKVNCAALPDTLIESELFGYEKGAFTGAVQRKKGRFELADGGTLFLDEIGDLPPQTQIKLLRVLQEREFERLGGTETIKANVRLITATNKNLEKAIIDGTMREDLFYRLNVFTIFLPPLRARKSDILLLAEHFLEKYEIEHGKRIKRISTPAIDMLTSYHFPGNVRELENVIERAVIVCDSNVIHGYHLPPTLQTAEVTDTVTEVSLVSAVENYEKNLIQDALKSTRGNIFKAANLLNSTERILGYKIKKYKIDTIRFKVSNNESKS
jgi:Nif-specific regulatory protein